MISSIFIKGNIPSSKNSKVNGKFFSKTVMNFLRSHGIKYFSSSKKIVETYKTKQLTFPVEELKQMFLNIDYPVIVGLHFVRGTKHKFDFINACQILFDLFTAFDIIPDDNMDYLIPECIFNEQGNPYSYDKDNPGVFVKILNRNNNYELHTRIIHSSRSKTRDKKIRKGSE